MDVIPGAVIIEPATNRPAPQSQPIQALAGLDVPLDDVSVRKAIASAEANNLDPQTLTMQDLAQGPVTTPVPQKFMKTDGTVDVDKIQASTRQLDEAIKTKETAVNKTVDDYMREYQERETKFRNMPNPEKLAANLAPTPSPVVQAPMAPILPTDAEAVIRRDYAADPLGTTARLLDLMIQQKFQPMEEKQKIEDTRSNIQKLAERDPRILQQDVFAAVTAKLQADPDLWRLKNPHKAAWLEVKEEMRLGEPSQAQAQPSRSTPVLGGGTPPSVPSSSVETNGPVDLSKIDLRDKNQEKIGDELIRQMLARR